MMFSQEELISILKKSLPDKNYNDLSGIAQSIIGEGEHWQEVDLNEHIHDDLELSMLHDICKRESSGKKPNNIRLFFK